MQFTLSYISLNQYCWAIKFFNKVSFAAVLCVFIFSTVSCKESTKDNVVSNENCDTINGQKIDLLQNRVKLESFRKDSLDLEIHNIYLQKIGKNEFDLDIRIDYPEKALNYYKDYYLILSIYPFDNEIQKLRSDRQKYNFETFSMGIRKTGKNKLEISRRIETRLKLARAITLSVIGYETKRKSLEVVMRNVNLLKKCQ